ncbi:uncharacterized protein LOC122062420 [Macadamia integrifolia]|uniref:uncharacterized protein LOC122062420 n=1 Tax=Macadamia integrifolia TaxID=60698 RepID=UPI001C4FB77E|nr:uncharacterized protein LOC122062420 [Macadamia integrifolia]
MCKEHRCSRAKEYKDITSTWIASHLATQLKANPNMKTSAMAVYFMEKFQVKIPYITLYRAKKIATEVNKGSHAYTFAKLPSYGDILRERNPSSLFKLQFHARKVISDPPVFKRLHLYQNFKGTYSEVLLRRLFWSVAKASTPFMFEKATNEMKAINKDAHDWSKPILIVIDEIRKQLLEMMESRYWMSCTYTGKVTPRIQKILTVIRTESRGCMVLASGLDEFEVIDSNGRYVIDLKKRSCGCKFWDATGLPLYKVIIHPLPDLDELPEEYPMGIVQPPPLKRLVERSNTVGKKEPDEGLSGEFRKRSSSPKCERCKGKGHNIRTYKGPPVQSKKSSSNVKRKKMSGSKPESNLSQRQTRSSQASSSCIVDENIQTKIKAQLKAKEDKRKAREKAK